MRTNRHSANSYTGIDHPVHGPLPGWISGILFPISCRVSHVCKIVLSYQILIYAYGNATDNRGCCCTSILKRAVQTATCLQPVLLEKAADQSRSTCGSMAATYGRTRTATQDSGYDPAAAQSGNQIIFSGNVPTLFSLFLDLASL